VSVRTRSHRRRPLGRIRPGVLVHETQTHACAGQGGDSVKHKDEACVAEHAWTVTQGSSERATSDSGTGLDRHGCAKADGRQVVGERHGEGVCMKIQRRFASGRDGRRRIVHVCRTLNVLNQTFNQALYTPLPSTRRHPPRCSLCVCVCVCVCVWYE